ncbi:PhzF family phenazine biosynthesis protein [Flavobacteriaceae sp. LMIT009]
MKVPIFQIDAFTSHVFGGNPAAVCPLKEWLPDETMLDIAKENNLAETAFFIHLGENEFYLRWFTPEIEMDLCGHGTLASAYVIFNCLNYNFNKITFNSMSGKLIVQKVGNKIEMNFPSRPPIPATLPEIISRSLSMQPIEVFKARDYVLVYDNEEIIRDLKVSASILNDINLDSGGIIVTARGNDVDFVSRFFTPGASVFEDPVTGSAHCSLIPFWADRLNKINLHAFQISERKGELFCILDNDRVFIKGSAVKYLEGNIEV